MQDAASSSLDVHGVIFDLDGTLVDSNAAHVAAWVGGLAEHDVIAQPDDIRPLVGMGGDQLLPRIVGRDIDARFGDAMREAVAGGFRAVVETSPVRILTGAERLLAVLRARGVRLALATSASQEDLQVLMTSVTSGGGADLRGAFDVLVTRSDVESSKPSPDVVEVACDRLGVPRWSCVMIGDTEYDMQAATRAGVPGVGVLTSGLADRVTLRQRLEEGGAVAVWPDLEAMAVAIEAHGGSVATVLDGWSRGG